MSWYRTSRNNSSTILCVPNTCDVWCFSFDDWSRFSAVVARQEFVFSNKSNSSEIICNMKLLVLNPSEHFKL